MKSPLPPPNARSFIKATLSGATLVILCALAAPTWANQEAGRIKKVEGEVLILRGDQKIVAVPGSSLQEHDRVTTGKDSSVGLTTQDNALVSAGPKSSLVIDRYNFDPKTHEGNFVLRFLKGTLAVISGKLAKQSPEAMKVTTPTSTIGIRGTEFIVKVDDEQDGEAAATALPQTSSLGAENTTLANTLPLSSPNGSK